MMIKYTYTLDLAERGMFAAHVCNSRGRIVWEVRCETEEDYENMDSFPIPWRDSYQGTAATPEELAEMEKYLKFVGLMAPNATLVLDR